MAILFIAALATGAAAQERGSLNVSQDSRISTLMGKQRELFALHHTENGFRVQIFMETGNDAVQHAGYVKSNFENRFPAIPIYLSYGQPYYRLRVGNFRNRLEAEKCLRQVKAYFPEAFVITDIIFPPEIDHSILNNDQIKTEKETENRFEGKYSY